MEESKVELHFTVNEVNLILAALSELPFKVSFELIHKIKQHAEPQVAVSQTNSNQTIGKSNESSKR